MKKGLFLLIFSAMLVTSGCAWVKLTPEGEQVRVLGSGQVSACKKIGKTTVSVLAKVGFASRSEKLVREELETLARNSAGNMGGDSIVPISGIEEGEQSFDVYKCVRP
jgi:hypothetical protein